MSDSPSIRGSYKSHDFKRTVGYTVDSQGQRCVEELGTRHHSVFLFGASIFFEEDWLMLLHTDQLHLHENAYERVVSKITAFVEDIRRQPAVHTTKDSVSFTAIRLNDH